ncbi:uncharacterized protein BDZ99DRAFT_273154 [Mytilinidion resinicola]|uniref:Uncharacterized protein n=1 Tax=Mytilinidion resinicola TaxID=574789 RepID=A0A6A6YWH4_9PEZI|nr:uncharacterized protein BDZ99DRAFT_273154 [Mytilinidion resinicola]KAF2812743.1 hypothetical protein BDZ99DRAFT_273154 [Mytilinidion resinicola]
MVICGVVIRLTAKQQSRMRDKAAPSQRSSRRRELSRPPKPASRIPFLRKRREQRLQTGLLFSRLPAELRSMIFSYFFGNPDDVVHILWMDKSLTHARFQTAKSQEDGDIRRLCFRDSLPPPAGLYSSSYGDWAALLS